MHVIEKTGFFNSSVLSVKKLRIRNGGGGWGLINTQKRLLILTEWLKNAIFMQFEAFDALYPGLEVCKPEVPTLITFQHGVEKRKWCDFRHYIMLS